MSAPDVRVKVAEMLGWKQVDPASFKKFPLVTWPVYEKDGKRSSVHTDSLPAYDTDANAALTVADFMAEKGWVISMHKSNGWSVSMTCGIEANIVKLAPTLPLAICLAALEALKGEAKP